GAALEAEHDLRVHQVAVLAIVAAHVVRDLRQGALGLFAEDAEPLFDFLDELVVGDRPGCHDHHAFGAILPLHERAQLFRIERLDRLRRAEDRTTESLVAEGGLSEAIEHDIVGRVVSGANLLQDDVLFALELGRIEAGVGQYVGKDLDRQRQVVFQHPRVEGRRLDAGRGVDLAADVFDFRGDIPRGARAGALEGHVLQQVRDAVLVVALVARARLDPHSEGNAFDMRQGFGRDRQAVGQTAYLNTHLLRTPWNSSEP